ncbi:hypothetical protein [Arthrobacter sp. B0490]|uniref:hypothetical protein n=1 Tax=Arthrobacter sp. B0490 TaxID=2058891 RepID=UPI0011B0F25C|nr:hypothetical protein [Arthrobacter sp. B0490]
MKVIRCRRYSGGLDDVDDLPEEVGAVEAADESFDDRGLDLFEDQRSTIPGRVALQELAVVVDTFGCGPVRDVENPTVLDDVRPA